MANVRRKREARQRRHARVRKKVVGTPERPRLSIYRSLSNIYVQLIDDTQGHTLMAASTLDPDVRERASGLPKSEQVGEACSGKGNKESRVRPWRILLSRTSTTAC